MDERIRLKNGKVARVGYLSEKDSAKELQAFINSLIGENAPLGMDRKTSLKQEIEWKRNQLSKQKKDEGFLFVARIDGKIAGTSGANREQGKGRNNVILGIAIRKGFRGIGLGEALLRLNIENAKKRLKPRNIYLSVFRPNKPAWNLYSKLGFREFASFPKWMLHNGRYVDHVFMKLG